MEPLDGARSNFGEYQIPSPDSPVESAHGNVHFPWISSQFAQAQRIPRIPFVATLERQSSAIPRSIQIPIFKIIQVFIPSGRSWQELQFQAGREIRELHPLKKKKKIPSSTVWLPKVLRKRRELSQSAFQASQDALSRFYRSRELLQGRHLGCKSFPSCKSRGFVSPRGRLSSDAVGSAALSPRYSASSRAAG